jgi:putative spermidine/putrescine transport system ATP-binding protein
MAAALEPDLRVSGHVEIHELAAGYDGTRVLDLSELSIQAGEFLSILGPSGCGKTTLLNCLAGFVEPEHGRILLDGKDVTALPPYRRGLGMVFQNYALFPHLTVADNVAYGLRVRKVGRTERAARVAEALRLVGLADFAGRRPRQLSGGQQQRVAIARALAIRPSVLLLDEPLSNLDAKLRREMRVELRSLQQQVGTTMVFVTHDQEEALALSDRVAVMNAGRVEQLGTPEEVYRRPRTRFVAEFIGAANVLEQAGELVAVRPERIRISSVEVSSTQVSSTQESSTQESSTQESSTQESSTEDISTEDISTEESCEEESAKEDSAKEDSGAEDSSRRGVVSYRAFAGDAWHVEVELADGGTLKVSVADVGAGAADPPEVSAEVGLSWDPADVIRLGPAPEAASDSGAES